uniref:Uncharacterized protein n=1 Tax=Ursus americanus TaxID=9643 RepID=A0A452RTK7_URSAM
MALPPRGTRPQGHHRDRSQPQAEAQVQDPRRHPSLGLGPQAAQRPHRGVGVASSQRSPRPRVPVPAARSRNRFKHRRGPPTRTHVSGKRGKRSRIAGVRGSHTRVPDLLDDTDVARPRATIPERPLLEGEKRPHGGRQGPCFYIGGSNGASIIGSYCRSKGWQRIQDSRREDYTLKWCEVKCRDNYHSFREGEQLLYQIPNNKLLTTKIGLLGALREYSRRTALPVSSPPPCSPRVLKMEEFFPETYRLDIRDEREAFFTLFDGERPRDPQACFRPMGSGMDQGLGSVRAGPSPARSRWGRGHGGEGWS